MMVTGVLLLAGLALLPPLLQNLYGYSVLQSGIMTAPRGVGTLISMLLAGRLIGKVDLAHPGRAGHGPDGLVAAHDDRLRDRHGSGPVIWSGVIQGLGLGLIFVTMQSLAFATLAPQMRTHAASLLNLSRNIGGSIGISLVTTLLARNMQIAHADMAGHITEQVLPTISRRRDRPAWLAGIKRTGAGQRRDHAAGGLHRLHRRFLDHDVADFRRRSRWSCCSGRRKRAARASPRWPLRMRLRPRCSRRQSYRSSHYSRRKRRWQGRQATARLLHWCRTVSRQWWLRSPPAVPPDRPPRAGSAASSIIRLSIGPGPTALTRILEGPSSSAAVFTSPYTACLLAI